MILVILFPVHAASAELRDIRAQVERMYASQADASQEQENALAALGVPAAPALLTLWGRDAFAHSTPDRISKVLFQMGPPVVPVLIDALRDPKPTIRRGAAESLFLHEAWGSTSLSSTTHAQAARALGDALQSSEDPVEGEYLAALWAMKERASPAAPALITVLRRHRTKLFYQATEALVNIGHNPTPVLMEVIDSTNTEAQCAAINALASVNPENASNVAPILVPLISEGRDPAIVSSSLLALSRYGAAVREQVPLFLKAARWQNARVREAAIFAAAQVGRDTPEVLAVLGDALRDPERKPRCAAFGFLSISKSKAAKDILKKSKIDSKLLEAGCAS